MSRPTSRLASVSDRKVALLVVVCSLVSCANVVVGLITPAHFQFEEVVPLTGPAGGWRAACVRATMGDGASGAKVICQFEVGIPIKTVAAGWITVRDAQQITAVTANAVAHALLSRPGAGAMLGPACIEFRELLNTALQKAIRGSRVRSTCDPRLKPVVFDPTRG